MLTAIIAHEEWIYRVERDLWINWPAWLGIELAGEGSLGHHRTDRWGFSTHLPHTHQSSIHLQFHMLGKSRGNRKMEQIFRIIQLTTKRQDRYTTHMTDEIHWNAFVSLELLIKANCPPGDIPRHCQPHVWGGSMQDGWVHWTKNPL